MGAGKYILEVDAGEDFSQAFQFCDPNDEPYDLTGYTARMHIRSSVNAPTYLVALTTENGGISITAATGMVTVNIRNSKTMLLAPGNVDAVNHYDLELVDSSGLVTPLVYGPNPVRANVTR